MRRREVLRAHGSPAGAPILSAKVTKVERLAEPLLSRDDAAILGFKGGLEGVAPSAKRRGWCHTGEIGTCGTAVRSVENQVRDAQ